MMPTAWSEDSRSPARSLNPALRPQLAALPASVGVYLFRNRDGRVLYVGKSVNVRQRVANYLRRFDSPLDERLKRMIHQAEMVEGQATATELLALLLEDKLIKEHHSEVNIKQNKVRRQRYLGFTGDPYPALEIVTAGQTGDNPVCGPLRDEYFAAELRRLVCNHFRLRDCTDPRPHRKSARFDLGHCLGPCRDAVTPADYGRQVAAVTGFLNGDDSSLVEQLRSRLATAAAAGDYQLAARIKPELQLLDTFQRRQAFTKSFLDGNLVLCEQGEPGATYLFQRGNEFIYLEGEVSAEDLTRLLDTGSLDTSLLLPRDLLHDRALLLYGWIRRGKGRVTHQFFPVGGKFNARQPELI